MNDGEMKIRIQLPTIDLPESVIRPIVEKVLVDHGLIPGADGKYHLPDYGRPVSLPKAEVVEEGRQRKAARDKEEGIEGETGTVHERSGAKGKDHPVSKGSRTRR